MSVLKVADDSDRPPPAHPFKRADNNHSPYNNSLRWLFDEFLVENVKSAELFANHSNESFAADYADNRLYHLVKSGQADTLNFPVVPSEELFDTFAFSNAFIKSTP